VHIPLGFPVLADGHVDLILPSLANRVQLLEQELDELGLLVLGNDGQTVDDDEVVVARVELDLIFLAQVGDVDFFLIVLVVIEVGLAQVLESGRHAGRSYIVDCTLLLAVVLIVGTVLLLTPS
jgi:hypothetical protein